MIALFPLRLFNSQDTTLFLKAENIKQPEYGSVCRTSFRHNPRNNTFTSVYEAPINMKARMQNQASGEVSPCLHAPRPGTPVARQCSGYCHKRTCRVWTHRKKSRQKGGWKFPPFELIFFIRVDIDLKKKTHYVQLYFASETCWLFVSWSEGREKHLTSLGALGWRQQWGMEIATQVISVHVTVAAWSRPLYAPGRL